jgi:hypothetical protein
MSEKIPVREEGKIITSLAADGNYYLAVHNKDNAPNHFLFMGCDKEYTFEEYCSLMQHLWDDYISKGKKPQLLGLTLTEEGLLLETLHCIAPLSWTGPGAEALPAYREKFAYWLKSRIGEINARLGKENARCFDQSLESILQTHIARKRRAEKNSA